MIVALVVTGLREIVMNAIPLALKHGITIGIGMFIALIGLVNAGFVGKGDAHGTAPVTLGVGRAAGRLAGAAVLRHAAADLHAPGPQVSPARS